MKCPKCDYLGFDSIDRCKNCGYDFSLLTAPTPVPDLALRLPDDDEGAGPAWLDRVDAALGDSHAATQPAVERPRPVAAPAPVRPAGRPGGYQPPSRPATAAERPSSVGRPAQAATLTPPPAELPSPARPAPVMPDLSIDPPMPPPAFRGEPALPLFSPSGDEDDQPLIRLPAAPRPPLSVRRTPDAPRRSARTVEKPAFEPTLQFTEEPEAEEPPARQPASRPRAPRAAAVPCTAGARLFAAAIDYAMLGTIDATVVYFTLRLAGLTLVEWQAVPLLPLIAFLLLLKVAYFAAFTTVGGQTIGKMAAGIRVVSEEDDFVEPSRAIRRALGGVVSLLTLGAGFIPALLGADGRAIHDRLAHTRVVALPSA